MTARHPAKPSMIHAIAKMAAAMAPPTTANIHQAQDADDAANTAVAITTIQPITRMTEVNRRTPVLTLIGFDLQDETAHITAPAARG